VRQYLPLLSAEQNRKSVRLSAKPIQHWLFFRIQWCHRCRKRQLYLWDPLFIPKLKPHQAFRMPPRNQPSNDDLLQVCLIPFQKFALFPTMIPHSSYRKPSHFARVPPIQLFVWRESHCWRRKLHCWTFVTMSGQKYQEFDQSAIDQLSINTFL